MTPWRSPNNYPFSVRLILEFTSSTTTMHMTLLSHNVEELQAESSSVYSSVPLMAATSPIFSSLASSVDKVGSVTNKVSPMNV
jgi:hypothetical protein